MNSTPNLNVAQADDALIARADERLAHAYEQIARADEQLSRLTERLSKMEHGATRQPSAVPHRKPSRGRPVLRGLVGLLLAACVVAAAFAAHTSYGDAAKLTISRWAPHLISTLSLSMEKLGLPVQPSPSSDQANVADAATPQASPSAPATARDVTPAVAPAPPEPAQSLHEMMRALADVEQGIEQLKAGQERMATENAKVVEQLRAAQEQMTRLVATTSEQNLAPRASAPPPRPIASPTRKPVPTHSSPQARAQPRTPARLEP